ncbi:hypothetical protein, partial [Xylophilus ampelinus]
GGTELRRWAWTSADLIGWQVLRFRLETALLQPRNAPPSGRLQAAAYSGTGRKPTRFCLWTADDISFGTTDNK